MFYKRILLLEEHKKYDVVYDHKSHDDIYACIDLQYDFKGYG